MKCKTKNQKQNFQTIGRKRRFQKFMEPRGNTKTMLEYPLSSFMLSCAKSEANGAIGWVELSQNEPKIAVDQKFNQKVR